jgi:hypothetical protein
MMKNKAQNMTMVMEHNEQERTFEFFFHELNCLY